MTPQQANEPKDCPFCGAKITLPNERLARDSGEVYLTCDCGAMGAGRKNQDEAVAAWNRRAPAPTEPAVDRDAVPEGTIDANALERLARARPNECFLTGRGVLKLINAIRILEAATPASPAVLEPAPLAPSYGPVVVVADLVRNLLSLDQALPIYAGLHVTIEGKRRCRTRFVSTSYERVIDGKWIDPTRKDVPYGVVVWAGPVADPAPQVAQASQLAPDPKGGMDIDDVIRELGVEDEVARIRAEQFSQPTSAEELQQKEHIPPFAEPASQHEVGASVLTDDRIITLACAEVVNDFETQDMLDFARAIEAELASRCRAQGGITNDSKGFPTSAEGKDSERLEDAIAKLTDQQRLDLFGVYCGSCGRGDPSCKCWNDE